MYYSNVKCENDLNILQKEIAEIIQFLGATNFKEIGAGRYEYRDDIFYNVIENMTKNDNEVKSETHEKYIDIHYLVEGVEGIGFAPKLKQHKIFDDKLKEEDYLLYNPIEEESILELSVGDYVVMFPWDIHRPLLMVGQPSYVKKVIFKVPTKILIKN